MKVLLDLPEDTVSKFEGLAKTDKRSRKACMELVLIEYDKSKQHSKVIMTNGIENNRQPEKVFIPAPTIKISQYDAYYNEIMDAKSVGQITSIVKTAKNDISDLSAAQRIKLEQIGIEQSKKIDF